MPIVLAMAKVLIILAITIPLFVYANKLPMVCLKGRGWFLSAMLMTGAGVILPFVYKGTLPLAELATTVGLAALAFGIYGWMKVLFADTEPEREKEEVQSLTNELGERRHLLRSLTDNLPSVVSLKGTDGRYVFVNKQYEKSYNLRWDEIVGYKVDEIFPSELSDSYIMEDQRIIDEGHVTSQEVEIEYHNDIKRSVVITRFPVLSTDGRIIGIGSIDHDISEQKQMEVMKDKFLSTVNHELRTPLTAILGSLGLVNRGVVGDVSDDAKAMLTMAHDNANRLRVIVDDLLDMENLLSNTMEFHFGQLNIQQFVEKALEDSKRYAKRYDVSFELSEMLVGGFVMADERRLHQVMDNLLSNAAKFSPAGAKIDARVWRNGEMLRVEVQDYGLGISDDFKDDLFDRFTVADSTDTRDRGGAGLGLNISKEIIEQHGGIIGYDSNEGIGSTFYFELPEVSEN